MALPRFSSCRGGSLSGLEMAPRFAAGSDIGSSCAVPHEQVSPASLSPFLARGFVTPLLLSAILPSFSRLIPGAWAAPGAAVAAGAVFICSFIFCWIRIRMDPDPQHGFLGLFPVIFNLLDPDPHPGGFLSCGSGSTCLPRGVAKIQPTLLITGPWEPHGRIGTVLYRGEGYHQDAVKKKAAVRLPVLQAL